MRGGKRACDAAPVAVTAVRERRDRRRQQVRKWGEEHGQSLMDTAMTARCKGVGGVVLREGKCTAR